MSTFTENYDLIKPDEADYYDVQDFNENMDTIDGVMAATEAAISGISEKIGTPATEGTTIFSLLEGNEQPASSIKSIQRVIAEMDTLNKTQDVSINAVDASRSFVILEKLRNLTERYYVDYTLSDNTLQVRTTSSYQEPVKFGFWIIEFY